jgi:cysteine-rich repeat protein
MRARALLVLLALAACKKEIEPATCPERTMSVDDVCRPTCIADSDCLFTEACLTGVCLPRSPNEGPKVRLFEPDRIAVTEADPTVRFDYVVTNATDVELAPMPGNLAEHAGTLEVTITESTDFTLVGRASGKQEDSATRHIDFFREPDPGELIVSLQIEQSDDAPCDAVDVQWTIIGDLMGQPLEVILKSDDVELFRTNEASGNTSVPIDGPRSLTMYAQAGPSAGQSEPLFARPRVLCRVGSNPPGQINFGDTILIEWETKGAQMVWIERESGEWVYATGRSPDPLSRAAGRWLLAPSKTGTYRVVAAPADQSEPETQDVSVEVFGSPPAPLIDRFEVDQPWFFSPTTLTVAWDTRGAANDSLTIDNFVNMQLSGESGTVGIPADQSTELWLTAERDGLISMARALSLEVVDEVEPNDSRDQANALMEQDPNGGLRVIARAGTFDSLNVDADRYAIASGGALRVRLYDPSGSDCEGLFGVLVEIEQEGNVIVSDSVTTGCLELFVDGRSGGHLINVFPPTASTTGATYVLAVDPAPVRCGDWAVESFESCDDGNMYGGDGCDPSCALEPGFAYDLSNGQGFIEPPPPGSHSVDFLPYVPGFDDPADEGFAILPANIQYFGHRYAGIMAHVNGYVTLLPDFRVDGGIGSPQEPNALIAGFGANLHFEADSQASFWETASGVLGTTWSIQWDRMYSIDGSNGMTYGPFTFRIEISEGGLVRLTYDRSIVVPDGFIWVSGIDDATGRYAYPNLGCTEICSGAPLSTETVFVPR